MKTIFFKKWTSVFMVLILTACSTTQKFEGKIQERNCEAALNLVPENQTDYRLVSTIKEASGNVLSYSATGAAYTVQVLWDVTATVGAVLILCSPTLLALLASASTNVSGPATAYCLPGDVSVVQAPHMGRATYRETASLRCPDVDGISQSVRKVSKCFADRGGEENREKALKALRSVEYSGSFYQCLSNEEREKILRDLKSVEAIPATS